jgi:FkbM family methyltransferase
MLKRFWKSLYGAGIRKPYGKIDPLQYLKRLDKGKKSPKDTWCFSDKDLSQYNPKEVVIKMNYRGKNSFFYCDPQIPAERKLISQGSYDQDVLNLMADLPLLNDLVLDVGAGIGAYSVPLAGYLPQARIHAFEPGPSAFKRLKRNLSLNRLGNITLWEKGLADEPGKLKMNAFPYRDIGLSTFLDSHHGKETAEAVPVEVTTLDQTFDNIKEHIGVLKIDVQGFEIKVLKGAASIISNHRPYIIFEHEDLNFHDKGQADKTKKQIKNFFNKTKYQVFYIPRYGLPLMFPVNWRQSLNGNLLAIPQNIEDPR